MDTVACHKITLCSVIFFTAYDRITKTLETTSKATREVDFFHILSLHFVPERYMIMYVTEGRSHMSARNVALPIKEPHIPIQRKTILSSHQLDLAVGPAFSIRSTIFHFVDPFQAPSDNDCRSGQEMVYDKGLVVDYCANIAEEYGFISILQTAAAEMVIAAYHSILSFIQRLLENR